MALFTKHRETKFGVGDRVRVVQEIVESGKKRTQTFEGMVISIRGRENNKSFTVRKIGVGQIGIERIFQLASPAIEKVEVVKAGTKGVKRAKLFYTRNQSRREIDKIYSRTARQDLMMQSQRKKKTKTVSKTKGKSKSTSKAFKKK